MTIRYSPSTLQPHCGTSIAISVSTFIRTTGMNITVLCHFFEYMD